jgi:heme/copper-type cytochrome/quinol oxidase subunit 1
MISWLVVAGVFLVSSAVVATALNTKASEVKWQGRVVVTPVKRFLVAWLVTVFMVVTLFPVLIAHAILRLMGRQGFVHPAGGGKFSYDLDFKKAGRKR